MPSQVRVFYDGTVQGVGFRFTVRAAARRYPVTGFVRNVPDGRVELVAEGDDDAIKALLDDIAAAMGRYIREADIRWSQATGGFSSFDIRFF